MPTFRRKKKSKHRDGKTSKKLTEKGGRQAGHCHACARVKLEHKLPWRLKQQWDDNKRADSRDAQRKQAFYSLMREQPSQATLGTCFLARENWPSKALSMLYPAFGSWHFTHVHPESSFRSWPKYHSEGQQVPMPASNVPPPSCTGRQA